MKLHVYTQVVKEIERLPFDFAESLAGLKEKFPEVEPQQLKGVIAQVFQRQVKRQFGRTGAGTPKLLLLENRKKLLADYELGVQNGEPLGVVRRLARERRFSAALTAKLILEEWLSRGAGYVRPSKPTLKEHFRQPGFISDGRLALEVSHASDSDENYGPVAEFAKHSVGMDYETRLRNQILDMGLEFLDEVEQRERGFDKTPDIKLEVPICIDGCIINWVESKALFGDNDNHAGYLKDQLWSYWNRFGPGMVIYWLGYVDEIKLNTRHSGILVADSFPGKEKITFFNPNSPSPNKRSGHEKYKVKGEEEEEEVERLMAEFRLGSENLENDISEGEEEDNSQ